MQSLKSRSLITDFLSAVLSIGLQIMMYDIVTVRYLYDDILRIVRLIGSANLASMHVFALSKRYIVGKILYYYNYIV